MMRYRTAQPFPDALLRIQLWRVCWLGLQEQPALRFPNDGVDGSSLMLRSPVMDDQQPFSWIVQQKVS